MKYILQCFNIANNKIFNFEICKINHKGIVLIFQFKIFSLKWHNCEEFVAKVLPLSVKWLFGIYMLMNPKYLKNNLK